VPRPPKVTPRNGGIRTNSRKVKRELVEIALTARDSWRLVSLPLAIKTAILTPRGKILGAIEFFAKIWRFFRKSLESHFSSYEKLSLADF